MNFLNRTCSRAPMTEQKIENNADLSTVLLNVISVSCFIKQKKRIRTYYGLNSPKINSKTTKEPYLNHKSHTMHLKDHNDVGDNFLILVTFFIIFDKPSAKPFCHQNSNIVANMKSSKSQ